MKVYVVLHGQTDFDAENLIIGSGDPELNEFGKQQAQEIAKQLEGRGIDMILAAPQNRTMDTAKIVAEGIGFDPARIAKGIQLFERSFGSYEGKPKSEVDMRVYSSWFGRTTQPNVETIKATANRVIAYMNNMVKIFRTKTMLLVVPEQVAIVLYWFFNGLPEFGKEYILAAEAGKVYEFDTDTIPDGIKNYNPAITTLEKAEDDPGRLLSQDEIDALVSELTSGAT